MSALSVRPGGLIGPTSVTIMRTDPLPNLPTTVALTERLKRFATVVATVTVPDPLGLNPDKFRADVATTQKHSERYVATKHPVEQGVDITDHVRRLTDVFTFTGFIVDSPFIPFSPAGATPLQLNRAHRQLQSLRDFANQREPLFVATSTKVYESMIILTLDWDRNEESGSSIPITLKMEEIHIRIDVVGDKLIVESANELGAGNQNDGGQVAP